MLLFYIWQDVNDGYDTYDSAVVAAESENEARYMNPKDSKPIPSRICDYWVEAENVQVRLLGLAVGIVEPTVICASFNAG